jgi:cytochrome c553
MHITPSKTLRLFVLVTSVVALTVSLTPSHHASGEVPAAQAKLPPAASRKVDYKQDIQPLLAQKCYSCHGPDVQQAGPAS